MNIGILDDNPYILDFLTVALEITGHTVRTHTSSSELLDILTVAHRNHLRLPYDRLIIDLFLGGSLSGLDVITIIFRMVPPDTLPIILISGAGDRQLEQVHRSIPYVPILHKPFKISYLLHLLETDSAISQECKTTATEGIEKNIS